MRQIKFRFWDTKNRRWCGWDISGWINIDKRNDPRQVVTLQPKTKDILCMQFTGLTDKNGKEIYESDHIKACNNFGSPHPNPLCNQDFTGEVFWDLAGFRVRSLNPKVEEGFYIDFTDLQDIEIIGNIYENEELLK